MKKNLLLSAIAILIALSTISSWGAIYQQTNFTPVQLSVWYGVPNWPQARYVDGLRLGIPYAHSTYGTQETLNGLELAIMSQSENINGLQIAFLNIMSENVKGMQLGFFSMGQELKVFQLNAYNFYSTSSGVQIGIGNIGGYDTHGLQLGGGNFVGDGSTGAQIGIVEYCDKYEGFQMGILNISSDSSSDLFQIGLINYCDNGFLSVFPFFNFSTFEGRENRYPRALDYLSHEQEED